MRRMSFVPFVLLLLLPVVTVSAQSNLVYDKDGVSLAYRLDYLGTKDVETSPGNTQTLKYYRVTATFANNSGKDVVIDNTSAPIYVSFFTHYSTAWDVGGRGDVDFRDKRFKAGASIEGSNTFLLQQSEGQPGQPEWSIPNYRFEASTSSAPATAQGASPNAALLDRLSVLYPKLKAGTATSSESTEIVSITQKLQRSSMTHDEMQRFFDLMK